MTDLDPNSFGPDQPCFGCSQTHPIGFRLRFSTEGEEIRTKFLPTEQYQGPPGIMHGGLVTTLADEIAAWSLIGLLGKFGFTAAMNCRLHGPVRIGVEVLGTGTIIQSSSRIVKVKVTLVQEGVRAFSGDFTFAILDRAKAEQLIRGPLPEAWQRFAR